jgi:hypothetical protein
LLGVVGLWLALPLGMSRGALAALTAAGLLTGVYDGIDKGNARRRDLREFALALRTFESQPDASLARLYPDVAELRRLAPLLRARHLSVFRNDPR